MPHALLLLPDVYESVARRVALGVTQHLARLMHLSEDTLVYLPGNIDSVPMNDGVFGNCCIPHLHYPSEERLVVRFQEDANDNVTFTTPVNNKEHTPLFYDPITDLAIRPVWRYVTLNVTLEYTAPNITVAQRWLDEQRARISMGRAENYTPIEYHYAFPRTVMALFKTIHETMESSDYPSGIPYEQWLMDNMRVPTTTIAALDGTNEMLSVVERQPEVIGYFDFTDTPQTPERNSDGSGTYVSSMTYTLRYSRPTHVRAAIPFLVHQNPIPKALRSRSAFENHRRETKRVSNTRDAFNRMNQHLQASRLPYVHFPETDDWVPPPPPKGRRTFYTGLIVLNKDDHHEVVDLHKLGTLSFTEFFLEYMFHQGNRLFTEGQSIFEFRLYENNKRLTGHKLSMRPGTTMIVSDKALDPTRYHHVQISFIRNWVRLDPTVIECLRRYPTVLYHSLVALGVRLTGGPANLPFLSQYHPRPPSTRCPGEGFTLCSGKETQFPWSNPEGEVCPMVIRNGVVTSSFMEDILEDLDNRTEKLIDRNSTVGILTVMFLNILTFKK